MATRPLTVVEPLRGIPSLRLRELTKYGDLLYFLAWRDVKVRYKQTVLGVAWAVIQPVFTMLVFTVFFGKLGGLPSDGRPYALFTFTALVAWQLFAYALTYSSQSLVTEARLISKVYFPRLLVPIASVAAGLVDFAIAFALLLLLMAYYGIMPTARIVVLPVFVTLALLSAMAVGIWLAALNVKYRDVRYALPFLTQFWLFVSPVTYPSSMVPVRWQWLYGLNPMAGVIEGFRWSMLGSSPPFATIYVSAALTGVLFVGGLYYFRNTERHFADLA